MEMQIIDVRIQEANDIVTIDDLIKQLTDQLNKTQGTPCEVYSRIVGYYRNTNNWNPGKVQEFEERVTFDIGAK